ncbi:TIR domain-containing protein [Bartonella vinsonii]|uniref:ABC-type sugar transport system, periplasmic component n=1 Tax=Bartonella vinsonii TaxID=33047 RepID=A0A448V3W1_BARVI|nr:nucleotide-binding protein [Bartonella vinsonii]VEJ44428.1 ABC-type sugar transport system, periplasmic component [Bartonella vinsonii]
MDEDHLRHDGTFEELQEIVRKAGYKIIDITCEPTFAGSPRSRTGSAYNIEISKGKYITWFTNTRIVLCHDEKTVKKKLEKELAKYRVAKYTEKSIPSSLTDTSNVSPLPSPKIFIVHGHDHTALEQLELILHKLKLEPYVLQNTSGNGSTIIEALEKEINTQKSSIKFGIVLLTPDDMGYAKSAGETAAKPRARQNVILEMGMLMSALSRKNVAILVKENQNIEKPSDISGIKYIGFSNHVKEAIPELCQHLQASGFNIGPKEIADAFS